jgi:hypothetical protein
MIEIKTETIINAPAAKVWEVLTNIKDFSNWNQFMPSIMGNLQIGSTLTVTIVPPGKKSSTFKPTLIQYDSNQHELRWVGILAAAWLFRGEHYFQLQTISNNQTRLIHGEKFSGILATPILSIIKNPTKAGFELMNQCLAKRIGEMV